MKLPITDVHMHIVPDVDDGAVNLSMSLDMLEIAYEQGVRNIFCTSHNPYEKEETEHYKAKFLMLQMTAKSRFPDLKLHMGCELLCAGEYIEDILYGLENGVFLPLGNSKYVLTELYTDTTPQEAKIIVESMLSAGWKPILAHVERYPGLFEGNTLQELINQGAMIQVNLYSLDEENNEDIKQRARHLVNHHFAHFVGSDSHRTNHRSPKYENGVQYIETHCKKEYVDKLCFKNAYDLIIKE